MVKRYYRDFKRVRMTAETAKLMVELLADKTFTDHFSKCGDDVRRNIPCRHEESGSLGVARMLASNMTISEKKRCKAHLDLPDDPDLVRHFVTRIYQFADHIDKNTSRAFKRVAKVADRWANRGPLERLAEAGLELD